jgi:hypothetical protein
LTPFITPFILPFILYSFIPFIRSLLFASLLGTPYICAWSDAKATGPVAFAASTEQRCGIGIAIVP